MTKERTGINPAILVLGLGIIIVAAALVAAPLLAKIVWPAAVEASQVAASPIVWPPTTQEEMTKVPTMTSAASVWTYALSTNGKELCITRSKNINFEKPKCVSLPDGSSLEARVRAAWTELKKQLEGDPNLKDIAIDFQFRFKGFAEGAEPMLRALGLIQ